MGIAQYNLSVLIPNDLMDEFKKRIQDFESAGHSLAAGASVALPRPVTSASVSEDDSSFHRSALPALPTLLMWLASSKVIVKSFMRGVGTRQVLFRPQSERRWSCCLPCRPACAAGFHRAVVRHIKRPPFE
jgi:hypothetical protein